MEGMDVRREERDILGEPKTTDDGAGLAQYYAVRPFAQYFLNK